MRYRSDLAASIAADPVALRSIALLTVAGAVALLLAMVAAAATVRADHDETAGDQYALELDGLPPARLRGAAAAADRPWWCCSGCPSGSWVVSC